MKLQKFLLKNFSDPDIKDIETVSVPYGANFISAKILQDGIYLWYAIPELIYDQEPVVERFTILKGDGSKIPEGAIFIDILSTVVETPEGQGMLICPLYKI